MYISAVKNYSCGYNKTNINFASLNRISSVKSGGFVTTSFFRDLPTLQKATDAIVEYFPDGTNILNYGCSDGSELLSILALLKLKGKEKLYKLIGLDIDPKPLALAQDGQYYIRSDRKDSFLINSPKSLTTEEARLQAALFEYIEEVSRVRDDVREKKSYIAKKDKIGQSIEFRPYQEGNILNIGHFAPYKKVGAVFFRNAIYFLTDNYPISRNSKPEILPELVRKIHSRLEKNGILVLGDYPNDFIYRRGFGLEEPLLDNIILKSKMFKPLKRGYVLDSDKQPVLVTQIWQKI